jgi:hypothetical protein
LFAIDCSPLASATAAYAKNSFAVNVATLRIEP